MKKLLKKIWTELTRVRSIQFISYETEEEKQQRLWNKERTIRRLTQFVIDDTLHQDNLLITESYARQRAEKMFDEAKSNGAFDRLNNIMEIAK